MAGHAQPTTSKFWFQILVSRSSAFIPLRLCVRSFGVSRRDTDLIGHDQPFFADQSNSAIAKRWNGIVVANQFVSIHRTADQIPNDLQIEMISLLPMPSERYIRQQLNRVVVSEEAQSLIRSK